MLDVDRGRKVSVGPLIKLSNHTNGIQRDA